MNILRSFFRHIFFSLSVNVELYTETGCTVEGKKKKMMEKICESFNVCFTYHRIERNKKCFLRMIFISQMKCVDLKKSTQHCMMIYKHKHKDRPLCCHYSRRIYLIFLYPLLRTMLYLGGEGMLQ